MKIIIGSDHRGFKLKEELIHYLRSKEYRVVDAGTFNEEPCDYPLYCVKVGSDVVSGKADRGVFICKTGIGSAMALNKTKGVLAALVSNIKAAKLSRLHNNANVIVLGSDFVRPDYAKRIVSLWLKTDFEGGRHLKRIKQIRDIEKQ